MRTRTSPFHGGGRELIMGKSGSDGSEAVRFITSAERRPAGLELELRSTRSRRDTDIDRRDIINY